MEQLVEKYIGCRVAHYGVRNQLLKGHDQEAFNIQPNEVLFELLHARAFFTFFMLVTQLSDWDVGPLRHRELDMGVHHKHIDEG